MAKTMKRVFICTGLAITWAAVPGLRAQNQKELLPAPLPTQVFTARKAFVSNAGGDTLGEYNGGPNRAYNQFYTALKDWKRYELVSAPADAELVFEISFAVPLGEHVWCGEGPVPVSGRLVEDPQFRLAIVDLKTHVLLWTFTEHVYSALLQVNRDKNFDQA